MSGVAVVFTLPITDHDWACSGQQKLLMFGHSSRSRLLKDFMYALVYGEPGRIWDRPVRTGSVGHHFTDETRAHCQT